MWDLGSINQVEECVSGTYYIEIRVSSIKFFHYVIYLYCTYISLNLLGRHYCPYFTKSKKKNLNLNMKLSDSKFTFFPL